MMVAWLISRLRERTSQAALAALFGAAVPVIQGSADWRTLVPVAATALLGILTPEGQGVPAVPPPSAPPPAPAVPESPAGVSPATNP